jgi:hypothetical protein
MSGITDLGCTRRRFRNFLAPKLQPVHPADLVIYRKCHGAMMLVFILASLCGTVAAAGYLIEPGAGWFPPACRSR